MVATYILAAGLLTSGIIAVLPLATAQSPIKDHQMANITESVNVEAIKKSSSLGRCGGEPHALINMG